MIKTLFAVVGLLLLPGVAVSQSDTEAVRSVFERYKQALLDGDGGLAAEMVDRETLVYFSELKGLALSADAATVAQRPFIDRLLIVTMRHELSVEQLQGMDLEDLLRHAIDNGWIAEASIRQLSMGEVSISGDEALGLAQAGGNSLGANDTAEPLYYRFRRQEGEWRFGFSSLVASLNRLVTEFAQQLGAQEDQMIFTLVEALSGRKVLPEIWDAPPTHSQASPP